MTNPLADPFLSIFTDRAEADQAFDLLRDAARRLRIQGAYDPRVAVTLSQRSGRHYLRLNFGAWLVLGFRGPGQAAERVDMALLADRVAWDERFTAVAFERKEGEPEVRSYELPLSLVWPMTTDLRRAFEDTLDFIADKFEGWRRATHWKQHNPEIIEAPVQRGTSRAAFCHRPSRSGIALRASLYYLRAGHCRGGDWVWRGRKGGDRYEARGQ